MITDIVSYGHEDFDLGLQKMEKRDPFQFQNGDGKYQKRNCHNDHV